MSIRYPLRIVGTAAFRSIVDADNRAIAGGLLQSDAEEIVDALNAGFIARAFDRLGQSLSRFNAAIEKAEYISED